MRRVVFHHVPDEFLEKYETEVEYEMTESEFEGITLFLLNDIAEVIE